MKVLVVDDNIAIQEILKDILIQEGHVVRIAGSIDEAVDSILEFRPNAILLDAIINDEDGLQVLVRAHEQDHDVDLNAVLIKGVNDEAPTDNSFIKAIVNKPFKSLDISAALSILVATKEAQMVEAATSAKPKKGLFGFKKRKQQPASAPAPSEHIDTNDSAIIAEYISSEGPMYGRSYVFFEKEPSKIFDFLDIFNPSDYNILVISSENSKAVKQNYGKDNLEVATLSAGVRGRSLDINALGTLTVFIKDYIRNHDRPIVMIENFTDIIDNNGLNHSLVFLHQLVKANINDKRTTFVVSVDPSILTTKDRNILLGDMSEYSN